MCSTQIKAEDIAPVNFRLGTLEVLNELLDDQFYEDLAEEMKYGQE